MIKEPKQLNTHSQAPEIKGPDALTPRPRLLAGLLIALLPYTAPCLQAQERSYQSILQEPRLPRLEAALLSVAPPEQRVSGTPGSLRIIERSCSSAPLTEVRARIVHTAVQEWAYFGFLVDDLRTEAEPATGPGARPRWRLSLLPEEVAEVADTVGGYWAAAPGSDWILNRQNEAWQEPGGLGSRWRDPWSAAFISWVMCESGLGDAAQFQRAIAHHSYIDQAIRARDSDDPLAAYHAFEPGETAVLPGDLLCNGLRPMYRSLRERRAQLGEGARTHCDIVVHVGEDSILTIGGNVRASVRMKVHAAGPVAAGPHLAPLPARRPVFAHLKLRGEASASSALLHSPTMQRLSCSMPEPPATLAIAGLAAPGAQC